MPILRAFIGLSINCRFEEGLRTLGVLRAIRAHPEVMEKLFVKLYNQPFSVESFVSLLRVNYSTPGSNRYHAETETYAMWLDYLEDISGKIIHVCKWKGLVQWRLTLYGDHLRLKRGNFCRAMC